MCFLELVFELRWDWPNCQEADGWLPAQGQKSPKGGEHCGHEGFCGKLPTVQGIGNLLV